MIYLSFLNTPDQELLTSLGRMARNCHLGQDLPDAQTVSPFNHLLSETGLPLSCPQQSLRGNK